MKLDLQLLNKVLFKARNLELGKPVGISIEGYDQIDVENHIGYAAKEGLLDVTDLTTKDGPAFWINRITLKGIDYITNLNQR